MRKCSFCGAEMKEDAKFCVKCAKPAEQEEKTEKGGSRKPVAAIAAVAVVAVCAALFFSPKNKPENAEPVLADSIEEAFAEAEGGEEPRASENVQPATEPESDEAETADTKAESETEGDGRLLIAVPQASLPLRNVPQLEAEAICELAVGTLMRQIGAAVNVDGREFYMIKLLDGSGMKGYVAANSCTPLDWESDDSLLDIVSVQSSLYTYYQMADEIKALTDKYFGVLSTEVIGQSGQGRDIYEVILGNQNAAHHILVQAGIHGREYMSTQLTMKMIEYYAANMGTGSYQGTPYETLFGNTAFHIVPMSNPDGVCISQFGEDGIYSDGGKQLLRDCYERDKQTLVHKLDSNGDMDWIDMYKESDFDRNAQDYMEFISYDEYLKLWKANGNGVDINRNFDASWSLMELKQTPSFDKYKGLAPGSEPETQVLMKLAEAETYEAAISYHARGQLIYHNTKGNSAGIAAKSEAMAMAANSLNRYQLVNTEIGDAVDSGGYGDWLMLEKQIPSITVEMGKHPCPVQIEEFYTIWLRNRELWAKLAYGMQRSE